MAHRSLSAGGMSQPRQVCPGRTYLLTRRTTRRYFLFRPDRDGTEARIFWYCLAVAAHRHGLLVHAANQLGNHIHLVVTDVRGVLPNFLRDFHRWLACATKAHRGWPAEVFDKDQASCVEPLNPTSLTNKMAYTIANATTSGLVRYSHQWPGAMTRVDDVGRRVVRVPRPAAWFDADSGLWPDEGRVEIVMPEALVAEHGSVEAARQALAAEVRRLEHEAWREAKRRGRGFLGPERAVRAQITDRGRKWELFGALNPTFAAGGDPEAAAEAVERLRGFRAAYRAALERWRRGVRDVLFPAGTWWMRIHHGVRCEPAPAPG